MQVYSSENDIAHVYTKIGTVTTICLPWSKLLITRDLRQASDTARWHDPESRTRCGGADCIGWTKTCGWVDHVAKEFWIKHASALLILFDLGTEGRIHG